MKIDRSKLRTTAFEALSSFLNKLHTYKSIGDFDSAKAFFEQYSQVSEEFLKIRQIVMRHKLPRRLELQPNVVMEEGGQVGYREYDESFEGTIDSYVERFGSGV